MRYSGIVVWVKGSVEDTWYPVYASSKKQNMVCLSSHWFVELAKESQLGTNGAKCAIAHLERLSCAQTAQQRCGS